MKQTLFVVLLSLITLFVAKQSFGTSPAAAAIPLAASDMVTVPGAGGWVDVVTGAPNSLIQVMDLGPIPLTDPIQLRISEPGGTTRPTWGEIGMSNGIILKAGEVLQASVYQTTSYDLPLFWSARLVR